MTAGILNVARCTMAHGSQSDYSSHEPPADPKADHTSQAIEFDRCVPPQYFSGFVAPGLLQHRERARLGELPGLHRVIEAVLESLFHLSVSVL